MAGPYQLCLYRCGSVAGYCLPDHDLEQSTGLAENSLRHDVRYVSARAVIVLPKAFLVCEHPGRDEAMPGGMLWHQGQHPPHGALAPIEVDLRGTFDRTAQVLPNASPAVGEWRTTAPAPQVRPAPGDQLVVIPREAPRRSMDALHAQPTDTLKKRQTGLPQTPTRCERGRWAYAAAMRFGPVGGLSLPGRTAHPIAPTRELLSPGALQQR